MFSTKLTEEQTDSLGQATNTYEFAGLLYRMLREAGFNEQAYRVQQNARWLASDNGITYSVRRIEIARETTLGDLRERLDFELAVCKSMTDKTASQSRGLRACSIPKEACSAKQSA